MSDAGETLSWFYQQLTLDEQVELLAKPGRALPGKIAERLLKRPGVTTTYWLSNDGPRPWMLTPSTGRKLAGARDQLDFWWQNLDADQKSHLLENRDGHFDRDFKDVVQGANRDPFNDPDAYLVVIVQDANNAHRFKLPPVIRAYVEMRAVGEK